MRRAGSLRQRLSVSGCPGRDLYCQWQWYVSRSAGPWPWPARETHLGLGRHVEEDPQACHAEGLLRKRRIVVPVVWLARLVAPSWGVGSRGRVHESESLVDAACYIPLHGGRCVGSSARHSTAMRGWRMMRRRGWGGTGKPQTGVGRERGGHGHSHRRSTGGLSGLQAHISAQAASAASAPDDAAKGEDDPAWVAWHQMMSHKVHRGRCVAAGGAAHVDISMGDG